MRQIIAGIIILSLFGFLGTVPAVTIHQCEDADGNLTFQEICPPGSTVVETKKIYTGPKEKMPDLAALQESHPVVLYSVATCDACDLVRSYLQGRGVPFNERDVADDAELQEELIAKSGELSVPVVTIGEEVVDGYNKPVLESKLDAAGYPGASADAVTAERQSRGN